MAEGLSEAPWPTLALVPPKRDDFPGGESLARLCGWASFGAFVVFLVIGTAEDLEGAARAATGSVVALAAASLLFLVRPRFPLLYAAVATAGVAILGNGASADVVWFCAVLTGGWCVLFGGTRAGVAYAAAVVLLFVGEYLFGGQNVGWAPWTAAMVVIVLVAMLVRHELVLVERLRAAQADLAERSRADERSRIARELHDVIAHTLTVSLLHITSARLSVEHEPADAERSLAEAERLARQSLNEVRATMGLLRSGPASIQTPTPTARQLDELVSEVRQAGADVSLVVEGDLATLPATVSSTIYRIVQEALTNAAKHAPGAAVSVTLVVGPDRAELRVDSAGPPRAGSGLGLASMKERAQAVGGSCTAGPGGRGWLVHASLPLVAHDRAPS